MVDLGDLAEGVVVTIVLDLPLSSVVAVKRTCEKLSREVSSDAVWTALLTRFFRDAKLDPAVGQAMSLFDKLAAEPCATCNRELMLRDGNRCPCVTHRAHVPLTLGAFGYRAGDSSLSSGGFSAMLRTLDDCFVFERHQLEALDASALAPLDVLVLCTTEGPPLQSRELVALRAWLEQGGALIVSAYSSWSTYGHYAADTVGFLGIETVPNAFHLSRRTHVLQRNDATRDLLEGPFGALTLFTNCGETRFLAKPEAFEDYGAVRLVTQGRGTRLLTEQLAEPTSDTLLFYPPNTSQRGVTGKGRVLLCSNYHWLADADYWNGGTFTMNNHKYLLLNFIAGALANRGGPVK